MTDNKEKGKQDTVINVGKKFFNKAQKDGYLPPREGTTKRPPVPGPVGNPVGKVPRGSIGPVIKRENDRMQMQ